MDKIPTISKNLKLKAPYSVQVGEPLLSPGLGSLSLESLLRSLPDVCTLRYSAGQLVVMGVASPATAHVQDMVAKQNTAKRGKRRGGAAFNEVSTGGVSGAWSGKSSYRPNFKGSYPRFQSSNYFPPTHETAQMLRRRMPQAKFSCPEANVSCKPIAGTGTVETKTGVLLVTSGGPEVFGSRVVQILRGKVHGLYKMHVESQYRKCWGEELPDNWISTMAGLDCGFVTEKVRAHLLCRVCEEKQEKQLCQAVDYNFRGFCELKENVAKVLQNSQGGILKSAFDSRYEDVIGQKLEARRFGFFNTSALLRSLQGSVVDLKVQGCSQEVMVFAHIEDIRMEVE